MTEHDRYFEWLCGQVVPENGATGHFCYHRLFQLLHGKTFYAMHERDENRAEDALVLRTEYADVKKIRTPIYLVLNGTPTVFEVLIALARKMVHEMEGVVTINTTSRWFWEIIDNLGLKEFTDPRLESRTDQEYLVDDIIERLLAREYSSTGVGGLFPLWKSGADQHDMEIWDQCQQYLYERYINDILW